MDRIFFSVEERTRSPRDIVSPIDGSTELQRAANLHLAAKYWKGDIERLAADIDQKLGCHSEVNVKSFDAIRNKAQRPSIVELRPWFSVAHVRDSLRFRTSVESLDTFFQIMLLIKKAAERDEIGIVKIDWQKFFRPSVFGWRMIAIDIRLRPYGLLVEYYISFLDLIDINEQVLHKIFEKWRNCDMMGLTLKEVSRRSADISISHYTYYSWLFRCLSCDEGGIIRTIPNKKRIDSQVNAIQNCRDHTEDQITDAMNYFEELLKKHIEF